MKRHLVQIPPEQVKKLTELDQIRPDLADYPISKKVHALMQEKLAEIFQSKSWFPHHDGELKGKWFEYIREIFPNHIIAPIAIGVVKHSKEVIGKSFTKILVATDGDKSWWGNLKADIYNVGEYLMPRLQDKKLAETYYAKSDKIIREMLELCEEFKNLDLTKLSKTQLIENYNLFYEKFKRYFALCFDVDVIDIVLEKDMKEMLEELMKTKPDGKNKEENKKTKELKQNEVDLAYGILTTPSELSYMNQEQLALYIVANKIIKNKELKELFNYDAAVIYEKIKNYTKTYQNIYNELKKLSGKYWWTNLSWTDHSRGNMKEKNVLTYILDIKNIILENPNIEKEIQRLTKYVEKVRTEKRDLSKKYNFGEEMLTYMDIFDHFAVYHDIRKEMQMKGSLVMNRFLYEISSRTSYRFDDLVWGWPWEVIAALDKGNFNIEEIRKRKEASFFLVTEEGIEQYSGEEAIKRRKEELSADIKDIFDFKGIIASLGRVNGKVKLCFSAEQAVQKIEKGDVLVTSMTMPDYLPAMKKASAIITDEGGSTCHAAIVSRELKIPCIVGTKIATRVLNDGDEVEVNANHGRVKITSRLE